jgi:hypothetical protein
MTRVWIYSLASSSDPDRVRCVVPWRVDEDLIFFGPCKKRIRERIRSRFLSANVTHAETGEDTERIFIVGVNGSNRKGGRKVVWAGKLSEVMTFAEAESRLRGERFRKLRAHSCSPLHVRPIEESGKFVGYEHVSDEHRKGDEWISDLVSPKAIAGLDRKGQKRILLRQGIPWETFDRDCCMLLENYFFARGQGIEFDEEALDILRKVLPKGSEIDHYAVFGRTASGEANGLRGMFLEITGRSANRFIAWLKDKSRRAKEHQSGDGDDAAKTSCT